MDGAPLVEQIDKVEVNDDLKAFICDNCLTVLAWKVNSRGRTGLKRFHPEAIVITSHGGAIMITCPVCEKTRRFISKNC